MNKKLKLAALSLVLSTSLFTSLSASAANVLYSEDTKTKNCSGSEVYMGPNQPDKHWGSCVGLSSNPGGNLNLNNYTGSIYTRDKGSCTSFGMVYVGPWDAAKHGGYCVSGTAYPVRDRGACGALRFATGGGMEVQSGVSVYVGPHDAAKHGGYCYSNSNTN